MCTEHGAEPKKNRRGEKAHSLRIGNFHFSRAKGKRAVSSPGRLSLFRAECRRDINIQQQKFTGTYKRALKSVLFTCSGICIVYIKETKRNEEGREAKAAISFACVTSFCMVG